MAGLSILNIKSEITVTVENILPENSPEIIVVSFVCEGKHFQGVLLDTKKKLLPCGIIAPPNVGPPLGNAVLPLDDKLFSASQRYTYFQEKPPNNELPSKRNVRPPARFKNARMTVRLRPRQVLCSKCRGICNENSEKVDSSSKKKKSQDTDDNSSSLRAKPARRLRSSVNTASDNSNSEVSTSSMVQINQTRKRKASPDRVPKHANGSDMEYSVNGKVEKTKIYNKYWVKGTTDSVKSDEEDVVSEADEDPLSLPTSLPSIHEPLSFPPITTPDPLDISEIQPLRLLRKKRSVGSMEDLWDEHVFEDGSKATDKRSRTPVIKISFGSGTGEGTVVEIPPKIQDIPSESEPEDKKRDKTKRDASAKAAKRALKKAKKEARRKMVEGASPATSPRYSNLSPRYLSSPRHPPTAGPQVFHKKHKHKVKHKKKHKQVKKENEKDDEENEGTVVGDCFKQKLSINLKRLNANAYIRCDFSSGSGGSDMEDLDVDAVPDFPGPPLPLNHSTLNSCETSDGRHMTVGDVVWGKIHGFPWWPGKVLSITPSTSEDEPPQAHVAWYGSSTSSLMSCDQLNPFLETFQMRYNKKKRGPYKEAIKQASSEARRAHIAILSPPRTLPNRNDLLLPGACNKSDSSRNQLH